MVSMMSSRSKKKSIFDLITDPEQLKASVKAHEEAIEARSKATADYKQSKVDAQATIDELDQKLAAHNKRQEQLDNQQKNIQMMFNQIGLDKAQLEEQKKQFAKEKDTFEKYKYDELKKLEVTHTEFMSKRDELNVLFTNLEKKIAANDDKHYNLQAREASVSKREEFLIGVVNQLKA